MYKCLTIFLSFLFLLGYAHAAKNPLTKDHYSFSHDPIDVVIVAHPKDTETIDLCIEGIRENGKDIRRVMVVSPVKLTDKAEWVDESLFPFDKEDVALAIAKGDKHKSEELLKNKSRGAGWYLQQLLKLYSPFVIPGISSNVLVLDADVIFMNPVSFLNEASGGFFCVGDGDENPAYFKHASRLLPGYKRIYPEYYSICHHMLFQKAILKDLFKNVERYHKTSFWKAFCACASKGASEYEIYFNYALTHTDQVEIRELFWTNSAHLEDRDLYKAAGYHFVAFHTYMKGKWPSIFVHN